MHRNWFTKFVKPAEKEVDFSIRVSEVRESSREV